MTTPRRDGNHADEFRRWVQANPRLDSTKAGLVATDCDLLLHKYKTHYDRCGDRTVQHMMWLEYKQFGAQLSPSQRDTLFMLHQALKTKTRKVKSSITGDVVTLRFWGVHVLRMSGADPTESSIMFWNKRRINVYDLEQLLRFDINPITLKPMEDRRHHTVNGDGRIV